MKVIGSKIQVQGGTSKTGHVSITKYSHSQVVCFCWKEILFILDVPCAPVKQWKGEVFSVLFVRVFVCPCKNLYNYRSEFDVAC